MELALTIFLWLVVITVVTVVGYAFWMTYDMIKHDLNNLDLDFYKEDKEDE